MKLLSPGSALRTAGQGYLLLGCLILVAVCGRQNRNAGSGSAVRSPVKRVRIVLGQDTILAEVAAREPMREVGLMYRTQLAPDEGMLFVFEHDVITPFWMKNTYIPLSIAFLGEPGAEPLEPRPDSAGQGTPDLPGGSRAEPRIPRGDCRILDIQDMAPRDEQTHHAPPVPYRYALELNQGWFQEHGVRVGDQVRILE